MKQTQINTEYIKLEQLLKLEGLVSTGGEAKKLINDGMVKVNGKIELARGKKLRDGDIVEFLGEEYKIVQQV